jgi:hypothetical protein
MPCTAFEVETPTALQRPGRRPPARVFFVTTAHTGPMSASTQGGPDDVEAPQDAVAERAELLPEELAAGSDDPRAQAEAVLEESVDRTGHPDPDASTQSGRRSSADTA